MARSFPAQTMGQVSVKQHIRKPLKGKAKGFVTTHQNWTLKQADREGVITLNEDGKIISINSDDITIDLPDMLEPEDVFVPDLMIPDDS